MFFVGSYLNMSQVVTVTSGPATHINFYLTSVELWSLRNDYNISQNVKVNQDHIAYCSITLTSGNFKHRVTT